MASAVSSPKSAVSKLRFLQLEVATQPFRHHCRHSQPPVPQQTRTVDSRPLAEDYHRQVIRKLAESTHSAGPEPRLVFRPKKDNHRVKKLSGLSRKRNRKSVFLSDTIKSLLLSMMMAARRNANGVGGLPAQETKSQPARPADSSQARNGRHTLRKFRRKDQDFDCAIQKRNRAGYLRVNWVQALQEAQEASQERAETARCKRICTSIYKPAQKVNHVCFLFLIATFFQSRPSC
ncbi:hypothetical protein CJ030_MR1G005386 [Morella rubra]|uniref:Uncharacterized protein n=1 Tax=Morella rubra TaxID=262757 RepID=A0A6A1WMW6_9ROSI|nr:hypothetical protein CJ030_MR2G004479 [Morella rubra]KAB1225078.1 hypothetical protein CJ030_MR1G005393 [Morella rubra]KAB1225085.1 hypothetical protein CJ030_MR1G005386 [Morella rubra]